MSQGRTASSLAYTTLVSGDWPGLTLPGSLDGSGEPGYEPRCDAADDRDRADSGRSDHHGEAVRACQADHLATVSPVATMLP